MQVVAIPLGNQYDHINYLLACPETRQAVSVDPFDVDRILSELSLRDLRLTAIVSTHEHWDHAGRNALLKSHTGAEVLVPRAAAGTIEHPDRLLSAGDEISVGTSVPLRVLATPGHTMAHISLFGDDEGRPFLICGDTLFGAGVGNCGYGGFAPVLYETIAHVISALPDETIFYPGHDYLRRNLAFTLSIDPENSVARQLAADIERGDIALPYFTTLEIERQINCFLRLDCPAVASHVDDASSVSAAQSESRLGRFLKLRELRDHW